MLRIFNFIAVLLLALILAGCASRQAVPTLGAAKSAEAEALYQQAQASFHGDNLEETISLLNKAIKAGSPEAAFLLSAIYEVHTVPNVTPEQGQAYADNLLRQSAEAGYVPAQMLLGQGYELERYGPGRMSDALDWYKRAALQGNADAQFTVGYTYASGEKVPRDYAEAAKWYAMGADQNHLGCINNLAILYTWGMGVPQSWGKAIELYQRLVDQGYELGAYNLGVVYFWAPEP